MSVVEKITDIATDDKAGIFTIISGFTLGFYNWFDMGKFSVFCSALLALTMIFCHLDKRRRDNILFQQEMEENARRFHKFHDALDKIDD